MCPTCGGYADYIEKYSSYYCYACEQYVEAGYVPMPPAYELGDDMPPLRYHRSGPVPPSRTTGGWPRQAYRTPPSERYWRTTPRSWSPDSIWLVNTGRALLIMSILALVILIIMPWVTVSRDGDELNSTGHYDFRLNRMAGNGTADLNGSVMDIYQERIVLAVGSVFGGVILGALMLYSPQIVDLRNRRHTNLYVLISSMLLILMAVLILYTAFSFFGWSIANEMTKSTNSDVEHTVFSFASVVASLVAVIYAGFAFKGLGRALESSEAFEARRIAVARRSTIASPQSDSRSRQPLWKPVTYTHFDARIIKAMLVLSMVGIICMPLVPWLTYEYNEREDGSYGYYYELEDEHDDHYVQYVDEPTIHGEMFGTFPGSLDEVSDDINAITSLLWLCLILSMLCLAGVVLDRLGYRFRLEWAGIAIPVVAMLILMVGLVLAIHISQLDSDVDEYYYYYYAPRLNYGFGGNIVPFAVAFVILPLSIRNIMTLRRHQGPWYRPRW